MKNLLVIGLCGGLLAFGFGRTAEAIPLFKKGFEAKYVEKNTDAAFKELAKKEGCNVCHVKGEKKDVRNEYGKVLAELIPGDAGKRLKDAGEAGKKAEEDKLLKELEEALTKAEAAKIDPDKDETYGDRLKANKLPLGQ